MKLAIEKYYPQLLLIILAFTFFTRVYNLHKPDKYVFDEVYHAVTAKLISRNDIRAYEWHNPPPEPNTAVDWLHPPYAKLTQATSMKLFGETAFGWRFSSVIFGVIVVLLAALLADELFESKEVALLAAAIVAMDGLVLTMSRIAMNDIHVTAFILLALTLYLKFVKSGRNNMKQFVFVGLSCGLAIGTKWSGLYVILIIGFFEVVYSLIEAFNKKEVKKAKDRVINLVKRAVSLFIVLILLPLLVYILSYSHMFMQGKDLVHLKEMHNQIWHYQTNLKATHPAQSQPYQWFLNLKPVWISVNYEQKDMQGDIYAFGNPAIFWIGDFFIFVSLIYIAKLALMKKKTKKTKETIQALAFLLFSYTALWLPWQLSPRIMFFYHYLPAVPLLVINLSYWIHRLLTAKEHKTAGLTFGVFILTLIVLTFVVWFPHWTNIPVPLEFKDSVYFALAAWKQS